MSQDVWSTINASTTTGTMLASVLTDLKDAMMSGLAGTSRPSQLTAGGFWIDTTNETTPDFYWSLKIWTGTADVEVFRINISTNIAGTTSASAELDIQRIPAADATGSILKLIKNRILSTNNGQVLDGDVIAEIQLVGRTLTSTDPVVAKLIWTSSDTETSSVFGGTFSMYSTADATNTLTEHLRFISGQVEVPVQILVNALQQVSTNVATAAQIVQLTGNYRVVELTGATATDLQGVNAAGDSKLISLHNRSTANITLKHQNSSATAVDRLKLPNSYDITLEPEATITLYYCTTDTRWKIHSQTSLKLATRTESINGIYSKWTSPSDVATTVNVTAYKRRNQQNRFQRGTTSGGWILTDKGKMYSWGSGSDGSRGFGDTIHRSSPVAVVGGLQFTSMSEYHCITQNSGAWNMLAIGTDGITYGMGDNRNGQLGNGDVTKRSSPVAVLGGLKFVRVFRNSVVSIGMLADGSLYSWGLNTDGQLGLGDVVARSSPVAVLGGLKFSEVYIGNTNSVFAVQKSTGLLYSWGNNTKGVLGTADTTPRSSPVAVTVLTTDKIKKLSSLNGTTYALTESQVVYGWGLDTLGDLGQNVVGVSKSSPVVILTSVTDFWVSSNTRNTVIAKKTDGLYYGWGGNDTGQLALGDTTRRSSPVVCTALNSSPTTFVDLFLTYDSAYGFATDGSIYGWGTDSFGELADNTHTSKSSPVLAFGGLKLAEIYEIPFAASLTDGSVYTWGQDGFVGGLGQGTVNATTSTPALILGPSGVNSSYEDIETYTVPVSASTVYSIKLGWGGCYFGNQPLGKNIEKITIDYRVRGIS